MSVSQDLGKAGITYYGAHDSTVAYEKNTIVESGGDSYISKQSVPIGTAISNTTYWGLLCNGFSEAEITTAVNAWLVAHPEATTTVQDGAITLAKLNSDIHDDVASIPYVKGLAEGTYDAVLLGTGRGEIVIDHVENGSATNSDNQSAVHTDFIPVNGESKVSITVTRPVSEVGAYYSYACTFYDASQTQLVNKDYGATADLNKIVYTTSATKYIKYTVACYDSSNQPIALRKGDFSYGDVVVSTETLYSQASRLEKIDWTLLHNMNIKFQGGSTVATGGYENGGNARNCMSPSIIHGAEIVKVASGYDCTILFYDGYTYLGKINANGGLDQVSGSWTYFTGTFDVAELMKRFSADGIRICVRLGGDPHYTDYYYNNSANICNVYSYEDQTEPYIEKLYMENGTWSASNHPYFFVTQAANRMRPEFLIPVKSGDVIYFDVDNGKYVHAFAYWANGLPGTGSKKYDDATSRTGNEYVRFAHDGYFMASFSLASDITANIDPDTFTGSLTLIRNSQRHDMQNLNDQALRDAMGAQRNFTTTSTNNTPYKNLPTFVHVTDVHGDAPSFGNAYDVAKLLKADAYIATGDLVYYYATDNADYIANTVADKETNFLMVMGNHDGFTLDRKGQYDKYIEPFATTYGYHLDDAEGVTYPTYYYRDFADKKIRVIAVNQFEYDGQTSNTDTRPCYTQAQMDFIVSALASTPQDYGVIIAMHSPEKTPVKDNTYGKFFQRRFLYTGYGTSIHPLADIVDAFISKTTLSETYNNPSGATPSSVTVTADFTGLNSGVEFIAYMCGHYHADAISYVPSTTNKQLLLNCTTTNSWTNMKKEGLGSNTLSFNNPYLAELCDLQRMDGTPSQDAFNVYVIDRENKAVKVVRIGSNRTDTMDIRDFMVIPYAD